MGFGIRIMPGVRVRVSSRGVRTSIGPRIARVHVGAGRTGFSTGVGPVGYYTSLGGFSSGSSRRSSSGSTRSYSNSYGISPAQANKLMAAGEINRQIQRLTSAHRENFPQAVKPTALSIPVDPLQLIIVKLEKEKLRGISIFARTDRRIAREQAALEANRNRLDQLIHSEIIRREQQAELDEYWRLLLSNDPEVVTQTLITAFGDNEAKAAVLSVEAGTATVLMMAPGLEVVPSHKAGTTSSGNVSIKQMTQKDQRAIYFDVIPSHALATAREAFAVCPGLMAVKMVVTRQTPMGETEILGAGTVTRQLLNAHVNLEPTPFSAMQKSCSDYWMTNIDKNFNMKALDLKLEPELAALLREITSPDVVEVSSELAPAAPVAKKFCHACGTQFLDAGNFCGECGTARI